MVDLSFLKKCKCHGVIPKFLNFKETNRRLKDSVAYRQCQRKLLEKEIFNSVEFVNLIMNSLLRTPILKILSHILTSYTLRLCLNQKIQDN